MIFIKTINTYFWMKSKLYLEKRSVIANNTLVLNSGFVNVFNLDKHSA